MPLIHVTHESGAFTDEQKAALAEKLMIAGIMAEYGVDTPAGRAVSYTLFHEVEAKTSWFWAGKPDSNPPKGGRFVFHFYLPAGASTLAEKTAFHVAVNDAVAEVLGVDGTFPNRMGDWVLIHEVAEGAWGVSGKTVGVEFVNGVGGGLPERADYFGPFLDAQRRMYEAHGFPEEGWRQVVTE